jgi:hypothetical protein
LDSVADFFIPKKYAPASAPDSGWIHRGLTSGDGSQGPRFHLASRDFCVEKPVETALQMQSLGATPKDGRPKIDGTSVNVYEMRNLCGHPQRTWDAQWMHTVSV